jgi:hypothetical protein
MSQPWRENAGAGLHNMRGISWKTLAGNAANRAKEYVVQKEYKNTFESVKAQFKGELQGSANRRRGSGTSSIATGTGVVERVFVFPGWAVRRYRSGDENSSGELTDKLVVVNTEASRGTFRFGSIYGRIC